MTFGIIENDLKTLDSSVNQRTALFLERDGEPGCHR